MTKLEEVARAIDDAVSGDKDVHMGIGMNAAMSAARAAIAAMREPTEAMITGEGNGDAMVWRMMIDAALKEQE